MNVSKFSCNTMKILYYYRRWECFGRDWYIDDCSPGSSICGCIYSSHEAWRRSGDIFPDTLSAGTDPPHQWLPLPSLHACHQGGAGSTAVDWPCHRSGRRFHRYSVLLSRGEGRPVLSPILLMNLQSSHTVIVNFSDDDLSQFIKKTLGASAAAIVVFIQQRLAEGWRQVSHSSLILKSFFSQCHLF